jgi:hypothetical protein
MTSGICTRLQIIMHRRYAQQWHLRPRLYDSRL